MLLCTNLGKYGRLGNQMFQYAALKGLAIKHNFDFCIPPSNNENEYTDHQLLKHFELPGVIVGNFYPQYVYQEMSFGFNQWLFDNIQDNTDIVGHFQSEKYFKHIREEILKDFSIKNSDQFFKPNYPYVAIHVRRTDYTTDINLAYHSVCSLDYYREAMSKFNENTRFLIVSDDIEWCKQQDVFSNCEFSNSSQNIEDLYIMSLAEHNIVANSSFSWWGAWLNNNENKIVIAPKKWFGPAANLDESDIIPEEWIRL